MRFLFSGIVQPGFIPDDWELTALQVFPVFDLVIIFEFICAIYQHYPGKQNNQTTDQTNKHSDLSYLNLKVKLMKMIARV